MTLRVALTHVYGWPEVRRGGERYMHELGAALARAGHQVSILTTAATAGRGRQLGVPVRYLRRRRVARRRLGPLADEVAFALQAAPRLAAGRLDVWHALGTADAAAATAVGLVRPVRSVYTDLGVPVRDYREGRPDRRLHHLVVAHVDSYVCLSTHAASVLERDYGRRAAQVGGGVDLARFQPAEGRSPVPALLYSGVVDEPRKRLALLLHAVDRLLADVPDLELWVSGPGDLDRVLAEAPPRAAQAVVALGTGTVEDQGARYGRAWATVLPSQYEAFGLCLLESLACGTPVVATEDGGGPADLVHPGSGVMSAPEPAALADACREALDLARTPGAVDACRAAAAPYDWSSAIVPAMEELYGAG